MSVDLSVNYGGIILRSPIVVGACPLMEDEHSRLAVESSGAGAIVLPSLFEEHVIRWRLKLGQSVSRRERDVLDSADDHRRPSTIGCDADTYLSLVNRANLQHSIPIIASLNGYTAGGWADFAGELQEVGADGVELNIHHPPAPECRGPRELEDEILAIVRDVNAAISIPLFVKLGQDFTSMPHLARRLLSGVQGMVMHGRSPDVDVCLDTIRLNTEWGLTPSGSIKQAIGKIMRVHAYCPAMPIAASGGIGSAEDVVKAILAGADVAMITSAIYRDGPDVISSFHDGLIQFMRRHQLSSITEIHHRRPIEFASSEERANYMTALSTRHTRAVKKQSCEHSIGNRVGDQ